MLSSPWVTFLPVVLGTLHQSEMACTPSLRFVIPLQRPCQAFLIPSRLFPAKFLFPGVPAPLPPVTNHQSPVTFFTVSPRFRPWLQLPSRVCSDASSPNSSPHAPQALPPPCKSRSEEHT